MLLFALTAVAILFPAHAAQPGIQLAPPVPISGSPWSAQVTAWALPPQSTDYLVEDTERLECPVQFLLQPDGSAQPSAPTCPEPMRAAALDAATAWTFQPVDPSDKPSTVVARFVVRFNATLGAMTLFAELDPGAQNPYEEGRPGLKLVRPATPDKPLAFKLKGKLRKAGAVPEACQLRARVGIDGRVSESLIVSCSDALSADAQARVKKARFEPGSIDGQAVEDVTDVVVRYLP